MKKHLFPLLFYALCLILAGCASIANKEDIDMLKTEIDQKISANQDSNLRKFQETDAKIEDIQKIQQQQQIALLNISEEMKNQIKELQVAIDDSYQNQKKDFEMFKKSQDDKNLQFTQDIETLRKSQNDLIRTSASLTDSMVTLQKDIMAIKTSIQQIASEFDSLNSRKSVQQSDMENLKKYYDAQIETLLKEIVRQESEIFNLKQIVQKKQDSYETTSSGSKIQNQPSTRYHIVQKGETLSVLAKKYNTSIAKIKETNRLKNDSLIIGQKLIIP